jgi:hypothetical protein
MICRNYCQNHRWIKDDPSVYWDEESQQAYLICHTLMKRKSPDDKTPGSENYIYKMSWDGREILDEDTLVYSGQAAEAAKIYKINGTWMWIGSFMIIMTDPARI